MQTLLQALLADVHWGLSAGRCERQRLDAGFAVGYVALQVAATYLVAWLMSEEAPVGPHVQGLWRGGAAVAVGWFESEPASPSRPVVMQYA